MIFKSDGSVLFKIIFHRTIFTGGYHRRLRSYTQDKNVEIDLV